jgi:hypothetical protein
LSLAAVRFCFWRSLDPATPNLNTYLDCVTGAGGVGDAGS